VGADRIQEVAVVRDDDHRAVAPVEHRFQPADGVDVEVVGRLVQQHDVRIGEQHLRQQHAQFPAGGDFAHRAVVLFAGDIQAQQQLAGAGFGVVTAHFAELAFQIGGMQIVRLGRLRVHVDRVLFLHHAPHVGMAHHHYVEHAQVFKAELVLAQEGHALMWVDGDIAGAGFQHAGHDLHQRRFATAVGADQTVAVAVTELDADVFKKRLGAELDSEIVDGKHVETL
jgi:hypothetical protein